MQFLATSFAAAATSSGALVPDLDVVAVGSVAVAWLAIVERIPARSGVNKLSKANGARLLSPPQQAVLACCLTLASVKPALRLLQRGARQLTSGNRASDDEDGGERITSVIRRVNRIVWMRAALAIRRWLMNTQGALGQYLTIAGLYSVIASTFYGCAIHPKRSNQMIYKMFRLFVGRDIFDAAEQRSPATIGELATTRRALQTIQDAFVKLLPYNVATNAAFLGVGASMSRKVPSRNKTLQLVKACLVLNTTVAVSCGVYVSTLGVVARAVAHWKDQDFAARVSALSAALAMPSVLALVKDPMVHDAFAVMFGQWSSQYLLRNVHLNPGPLLVSGAYLGTTFAPHGGNGWLTQVVLGAVQKRLKSQTAWN